MNFLVMLSMMHKVLQINTHRSPEVLQALTANPETHHLDVVAVSEPPQRTNLFATYVATNSPFIPFYPTNFHSRACILLNRHSRAQDVEPTFFPDITILSFTLGDQRLSIISLYNPPSSPNTVDASNPVSQLDGVLSQQRTSMVGLFGDFNLHHEEWSHHVRTPHQLASDLLEVTRTNGLNLITPKGLVTWQRGQQKSTLDLAFLSSFLQNRLVSHEYYRPADCGSDHLPLCTTDRKSVV